ncbi:berberine bridge enzyme-like 21 [Andrographis paniculata]|uniref:berberine bridge enzyme-like 21 n=1 Tax=Andrographis paniculata TaxID=175694 RepID=UPI0021E799CD|nr:berberine bridge enzyme-like 21 [Andrographis paniculata]
MEKKYLLIFPFLFLLNSAIILASPPSIYDAIFECFQNHKIPKPQISEILYSPTNPSFPTILQSTLRNRRFNSTATPKPAAIVTPVSESHVSAAVVCATAAGANLRIRSGGHDTEGSSYVSGETFVVVDMTNFRSVDVCLKDGTAWVDSGAILGELYYEIWRKSNELAFPSGDCPTVGAGGIISGGGYGNLMRKYGLSIDHVIDARAVLADGRILDRRSMGEDLFWAIRGGGAASFAVVLGFKIKLVPVPPLVTVFQVQKSSMEETIEAVYKYQQLSRTIDDDLFIRFFIWPINSNKTTVAGTGFIGLFLGNATRLLSIMDSQFPELGLRLSDCREMPWINSVLMWAGLNVEASPRVLLNRNPNSASFFKWKSDYVKTVIPKSVLKTMFDKVVEIRHVALGFNWYGGVMSRIPSSATAFPHRAGNLFKIQYLSRWDEDGEEIAQQYINATRQFHSFMTPFVSKNPREAYLNYHDLDLGIMNNSAQSYEQGRVYGLKYFKDNFDKLVKIKTKFDPNNVFRNEQSIPISPF